MKKLLLLLSSSILWVQSSLCCFADDDFKKEYVVIKPSPYSYQETIDRVQSKASQSGFSILASFDYGPSPKYPDAKKLKMFLLANSEYDSALLGENPLTAHLIPFKMIIWKEAKGSVFISYMQAEYLDEVDLSDKEDLLKSISAAIELYTDDVVATITKLPELI